MNIFKKVYNFYRDGLKSMSVGRTLWIIIAIKLVIMFLVLRIFFFKPELSKFQSDSDKAKHVIENLIMPAHNEEESTDIQPEQESPLNVLDKYEEVEW